MVSLDLTVEQVKESVIPSVIILDCKGTGNESVTIEYSEKLGLVYEPGDKLVLSIVKSKFPPHKENDYCGRVILYSIKENKKKTYLFSVGGFIIRIESPRKLRGLSISEEYYFCLTKK